MQHFELLIISSYKCAHGNFGTPQLKNKLHCKLSCARSTVIFEIWRAEIPTKRFGYRSFSGEDIEDEQVLGRAGIIRLNLAKKNIGFFGAENQQEKLVPR